MVNVVNRGIRLTWLWDHVFLIVREEDSPNCSPFFFDRYVSHSLLKLPCLARIITIRLRGVRDLFADGEGSKVAGNVLFSVKSLKAPGTLDWASMKAIEVLSANFVSPIV